MPEGRLQGTDLGIGVRYASSFSLETINAPSYVVVDAMARYPITDAVSAQLSVENLFDRTYYTRVNQITRGNFYGTPRRITLSVNMRF